MANQISRRTFLGSAGALIAASQFPPRADGAADTAAVASGQDKRRVDVLIIGAGAAGLGAARQLIEQGKSVLVIEARDRIGGRVWTNRTWKDLPVDLGASWIHGHKGNPITELAERFMIATAVTNFDSVTAYDENGKPFNFADVLQGVKVFGEMKRGLDKLEKAFGDSGKPPTSLEAAIRIWQDSANVPPADRRWQRLISRNEIESEFAANLDEMRFPRLSDDEEFSGEQRVFPGGYGAILDGLAQGLDIRLRTLVRSIDSSRSPVVVETNVGRFEAERVLVTVPLGVLKSGAIRFTPELPASKRGSIDRLGMGLLDKVALRFDQSFWPKQHILAFLSDRADQWPDVFNWQPMCGQPLLVGFKSGRAARADEGRTDEELVGSLMRQLRCTFGAQTTNPVTWHVTRWASDPLAGGSYSYLRVGASPDDYDTLAEPVADRLFFAGEATNRAHSATVHGAYLSGLREARRILAL